MKQKLTSRKFWVAVATILSGVLMMLGFAETSVEVIAGAVVALGGSVGYMIAEGMVDAQNIVTIVESGAVIADEVKKELED